MDVIPKYKMGDNVMIKLKMYRTINDTTNVIIRSGVVVGMDIMYDFKFGEVYQYDIVFTDGVNRSTSISCLESNIISYDRDSRIDKILGYE